MKSKYSKIFILALTSICIGIAIIIISFSPNINLLQIKSIERLTESRIVTNIILSMLGDQIPGFNDSLGNDIEKPSFYNMVFEITTGVNSNDIATLLTQEIPGFNESYTEIYIAGKGSDYSNLPQESPPPDFDKLLKEQESNDDNQSNQNKPDEDTGNINNYTQKEPSVFIYHSHSWEAYLPLIDEEVSPSDSSSIHNNENVVLVGSMLSEQLKKYGIETSHKQINMAQALRERGWNYTNSYTLSREHVEAVASQNKNIKYFIDIHRDSARKESTTISIGGKDYARLYFVVGKGHADYKENLNFAEQFHRQLEVKYPGISKGVYLKTQLEGNGIYNQDISSKSLLVEVGGVDNNKEDLENTVKAFADVFKDIYDGAIQVDAQ